jgi:hypothetical protein
LRTLKTVYERQLKAIRRMCSLEKEEERFNKMLQYQQNLGISQTPPYFLAIGIGFGVQNLINNFISGFIIMLERPIKIGDMFEMKNSGYRYCFSATGYASVYVQAA